MFVSRLTLKNWRNFKRVDNISLCQRQFIVGPNASGKSNLLDVFRFLRDIARSEGGGLQKAVNDRGGISKIRCLSARQDPEIVIDITLSNHPDEPPVWRYAIGLKQGTKYRQPIVTYERVWKGSEKIIDRPDDFDKDDEIRLKQTYLEQVNSNKSFRDIVKFFEGFSYIHLVPQLLRHADLFQSNIFENDPFGQGFLVRVAKTSERTQKIRLGKIEEALKIAVPQLKQLKFERDKDSGKPHLSALYSHWRPNAGWQREDQFSDGTLRLIGLLWALLEGESLLLLEEPELSLNSGIVAKLASLISRMQRQRKRQVLISTHSESLLSDKGIDGREVLLLVPEAEGTKVDVAINISDIKPFLEAGFSVGEVVLPKSKSSLLEQLELFK
jgi:predicted ATPase